MVVLEEATFAYSAGEKKLYYLEAGPTDGPLIVFIHGWPAIAKTWKPQLEAFALLGFRAVAPDMPGYGGSTSNKIASDYSMENVNISMLSLLQHLGRDKAVWIGHDWGAPAVWSFAAHYPENCVAVGGISVPYGVLEIGLEEAVKTVNRDIYPEDKYPYGPWDYQRFYETDFEKATAWFDIDVPALLRVFFHKTSDAGVGKPASTSAVRRDGGWFGGIPKPDPNWRHIPDESLCIDPETYQALSAALQKTGFWTADAWYSNHERNRAYFFEKAKNGGNIDMPVLFIASKYDHVCDTDYSTLGEPQRKFCKNLKEVSLLCGHWAAQEKPLEVNAAISKWLVESVNEYWPTKWTWVSP